MPAHTTRFALALLVILAVCGPARAAKISADDRSATLKITIEGEITPGDEGKLASLVQNFDGIYVNIDSEGGDVETAMRIGRILRKKHAFVWTGGCYSSCVLAYVGAVHRPAGMFGTELDLGVHRIYFADLKSNMSNEQIKSHYDALLNQVGEYLAEMNIAPEFLSFMQQFRPESMHMLTEEEFAHYIGPVDPIENEREVADQAAVLGIASAELRKRSALMVSECADISGPSEDETKRMRSECMWSIYYGISTLTYRERNADVVEKCRPFLDPYQNTRCQNRYMATGRAVP